MKEAAIRAVIFDFDGTLARLTLDFSHLDAMVERVLTQFGTHPGEEKLYMLERVEAICARLSPEEAARARALAMQATEDVEVEAARASSLFPFVRTMLKGLREQGLGIGVVTRNCSTALLTVFPDLHTYIDCLLTREDVLNVKPHPEHLTTALQRLNVRPEAALMVGDDPMDIHAGQAVGTLTAGVSSGHASYNELASINPTFMAEDAGKLVYKLKLIPGGLEVF